MAYDTSARISDDFVAYVQFHAVGTLVMFESCAPFTVLDSTFASARQFSARTGSWEYIDRHVQLLTLLGPLAHVQLVIHDTSLPEVLINVEF